MEDGEHKRRKIVLLASLQDACGNTITATRIKYLLEKENHVDVKLIDIHDVDAERLVILQREEKIALFIGIHAYRAGRFLKEIKECPYIIIFGGTDINEHVKDQQKRNVMREACSRAVALVCFTQNIKHKAENMLVECKEKLFVISPSIVAPQEAIVKQAFKKYCHEKKVENLRQLYGAQDEDLLFLLPCGIRPVKDPAFLLESFKHYNESSHEHRHIMIIVGPILDKEYFRCLKLAMANNPNVRFCPSMDQDILHGAMLESDGIINSSKSEGLANVLLEAMYLRVPVFARDIDGNKEIIKHKQTGVLYNTPKAFHELVEAEDRQNVTRSAYHYVTRCHAVSVEAQGYKDLLNTFI